MENYCISVCNKISPVQSSQFDKMALNWFYTAIGELRLSDFRVLEFHWIILSGFRLWEFYYTFRLLKFHWIILKKKKAKKVLLRAFHPRPPNNNRYGTKKQRDFYHKYNKRCKVQSSCSSVLKSFGYISSDSYVKSWQAMHCKVDQLMEDVFAFKGSAIPTDRYFYHTNVWHQSRHTIPSVVTTDRQAHIEDLYYLIDTLRVPPNITKKYI